jgi:lysophospholipase L1-like esterase
MNVRGERILIFGDSLSHPGQDSDPEIWSITTGSNRVSSAPGDLLASLLLEQGAQAVQIDANVGRSAANFWRGTAKRQLHTAQQLIAADQAFKPTKVIVMLGTNDADAGAMDLPSITKIRDTYKAMGAEVWAVGPPSFVSSALNAKAAQVYPVMADVFGAGRLIDTRTMTLATLGDRASDGVHFKPTSAKMLATSLADKLVTMPSPKPMWLGVAGVFGGVLVLGLMWGWWRTKGQQLGLADGVDDDHDELADDDQLDDAKLDRKIARQSLKEERKAIHDYGERFVSAESPALKKAIRHARKEERQHAASFEQVLNDDET